MFRAKIPMLISLLVLLSACGVQTPPELSHGLEQTIDLATQLAGPDKFRVTIIKKMAGPKPAVTDVEIVLNCNVKTGKTAERIALVGNFDGAGTIEGHAPKRLLGSVCTLTENGTLGSRVNFKVLQLNTSTNKWDNLSWHSTFRLNTMLFTNGAQSVKSGNFKLQQYPFLRIIVTNQYAAAKTLTVKVNKEFRDGNTGGVVLPTNVNLDLTIKCQNGVNIPLKLNETFEYEGQLPSLRGESCKIQEKFISDDYRTKNLSVVYVDNSGNKGQSSNDCVEVDEGNAYDYCQSSVSAEPFHIAVGSSATTLSLQLVDTVHKKAVDRVLTLNIGKNFVADAFGDGTTYPEYPEDYDDFVIDLVCDGYRETIELANGTYQSNNRNDLYGKTGCFLIEHLKDDTYRIEQTVFRYYLASEPERVHIGGTYNDAQYDGYDTVNSDDGGRGQFTFDPSYETVKIAITNRMEPIAVGVYTQ